MCRFLTFAAEQQIFDAVQPQGDQSLLRTERKTFCETVPAVGKKRFCDE